MFLYSMGNYIEFHRQVQGVGIMVPEAWWDFELYSQYRHIYPISSVAQIAIEHEEEYGAQKHDWEMLEDPTPHLMARDHLDETGSSVALATRRVQTAAMEITSDLQHGFRAHYIDVADSLFLADHRQSRTIRLDNALQTARANTMSLMTRNFRWQPTKLAQIRGLLIQLDYTYRLEPDLHFREFLDQ